MFKKVKKILLIILTVITLSVNSIGVSYIKPMQVHAIALPITVGIDVILKLLLGTVVTVSGIVVVDKADELGVFDDLYESFMTDGSSALDGMPDYDDDTEIGSVNGKIYYIADYKKNGSGGGNNPNLKDPKLEEALKLTNYKISSEFMKYMIDFTKDKLKADSDIESVRKYYEKYGKENAESEDLNIPSINDVEEYTKDHDKGLSYDGSKAYYSTVIGDRVIETRIVKFRFENIFGYSPSGLSKEGYYTDTSGYQVDINPYGYETSVNYNGGRICITCQNPFDRNAQDRLDKITFGNMRLLYEVGGDDKEYVYTSSTGEGVTLQGAPFRDDYSALTVNEYDFETGLNGSNWDTLRTSDTFPCYPSANVPVFTNYIDGVRYVMGIDGLENAINVNTSSKYILPCDDLLPKTNELIKPLTDKELNAGILPEVITQAEQAILPEPLPEGQPVTQPQEVPEEYPDKIGEIIGDLVEENTVIPIPTPTPTPNPEPFPEVTPNKPITDNAPIQNAINKSLNLADFFPFCIPFDLIRLVNVLNVEPQAPYFEYPIKVEGVIDYVVAIDFSKYELLAQIVRIFETLIFIGALIMATRKLIRG